MFSLLCARERDHARHLFRAHAKGRESCGNNWTKSEISSYFQENINLLFISIMDILRFSMGKKICLCMNSKNFGSEKIVLKYVHPFM